MKKDQPHLNPISSLSSLSRYRLIKAVPSRYAIRSESKNAAVYSKEIEPDQEDQPAGAIVSCRRSIDHPQEWKVLYLSIDRPRTMASHHDRNRIYEQDLSIFELI